MRTLHTTRITEKASITKAKLQMVKEDKQLAKERARAKEEIEVINEKLKDPDLDGKEKQTLEEDLRELVQSISLECSKQGTIDFVFR